MANGSFCNDATEKIILLMLGWNFAENKIGENRNEIEGY